MSIISLALSANPDIMQGMTWRILAGIGLFISVFVMPFWFTVLYALACLYFFASFYEVIPAFALIDLLYGRSETRYLGFGLVGLALALVFVFGMQQLKEALLK